MANTGYFIYGIVPGDVEETGDAHGLGDPPAPVTAVLHGEVGALVSEVELDRPLGTPDDLVAYQRLLDSTVTAVPVLPVRFGTAVADVGALEDFLAERHDQFAEALRRLDGYAEFVVRARYVLESLLSRILAGNEEAATLRDQIRGQPAELTVSARTRLGEIVYQAVEAERAADTRRLVEALRDVAAECRELPASHEEDAANLALLVQTGRRDEFGEALREVAEEWGQRATVRLLGPLAPYDFVATDLVTAPGDGA
jgi:hypothetical protein